MYNKFLENKNVYPKTHVIDQDILNDVAFGKVGYLPIRFGLISPFSNDYESDYPPFKTDFSYFAKRNFDQYPYIPKNQNEVNSQAFNPVVVHHWNGKWLNGIGLTVYKRIAQYYIRYSGIWDEMCLNFLFKLY